MKKRYIKLILIWLILSTFIWMCFAVWNINVSWWWWTWMWWWWWTWTSSLGSILNFIQKIINVLYLIIWPLSVLWWKFLSNSFVYWEAFKIDNVLVQFWQITRTFMNYILWVLFITSIFVYFLKDNSKWSFKALFPKIVLASIVVNMSWFIIAVLLDISSVLMVMAWSMWTEFNTQISKTSEWEEANKQAVLYPITINTDSRWQPALAMKVWWENLDVCIKDENLDIKNAPCISFMNWWFVVLDKNGNIDKTKTMFWIPMSELEWNVGMLFSLFRYMNWLFLTDNTNQQEWILSMYILRILLLLALIIPFFVLSIILIVRVMLLWLIIPLSPVIFWFTILWIWEWKLKAKVTDVLTLIFQPAYVVFMLVLWFIFVQATYTMIPVDSKKNVLKELWFKVKKNSLEYENILTIEWDFDKKQWTSTSASDIKNVVSYISWLIVNILAIFIMWMLVFTALKSNKFTWKIATTIDSYAKEAAKAIPILPWWQSISSLSQVTSHLKGIPQQLVAKDYQKLKKIFKK